MSGLLHRVCADTKHWVLDVAHPLPTEIRVFAGAPGSIEEAVLSRLIQTCRLDHLARVPVNVSSMACAGEPDIHVTHASTETVAVGFLAICRYLGRLWRLYPVHPEHALLVDSNLEILSSYTKPLRVPMDGSVLSQHTRSALTKLDGRLSENTGEVWLGDLNAPSVADHCWFAALQWIGMRIDVSAMMQDFPDAGAWWETMCVEARDKSE